MSELKREDVGELYCRSIQHQGIVYLSGVTAKEAGDDIRSQTRRVLEKIDSHLAKAGTDKTRILTVQVWLKNVEQDLQGMNQEWLAWVPAGQVPTRATGESRLGDPAVLVEIIATAAAGH